MAIFTGTAGDDSILGTASDDEFHLEQGGDDTASGGAGVDLFFLGASFTAADHIDGGKKDDTLVLDGDYAAGLTFATTSLTSVERIYLTAGHSYRLAGLENIAEADLTVQADGLGADDALRLDASARLLAITVKGGAGADALTGGRGGDWLDGGLGDDTLKGGEGDDQLFAGAGGHDRLSGGTGNDTFRFAGDFGKGDRVDGGGGSDALYLSGGQAKPIALTAATVIGINYIGLTGGAYDITMDDHVLGAGGVLNVTAFAGGQVRFDGSQETDGRFGLSGGDASDTLIGGAGDDLLYGQGGDDTMLGGAGDDILTGAQAGKDGDKFVGGAGADVLRGAAASPDRYFFLDVQDSTAAAPDRIVNLGKGDIVWLQPIDADLTTAGNQAFHLVSALTGHAGELALVYDGLRDVTRLEGDVDGDGLADLVITADGNHTDFTRFAL